LRFFIKALEESTTATKEALDTLGLEIKNIIEQAREILPNLRTEINITTWETGQLMLHFLLFSQTQL